MKCFKLIVLITLIFSFSSFIFCGGKKQKSKVITKKATELQLIKIGSAPVDSILDYSGKKAYPDYEKLEGKIIRITGKAGYIDIYDFKLPLTREQMILKAKGKEVIQPDYIVIPVLTEAHEDFTVMVPRVKFEDIAKKMKFNQPLDIIGRFRSGLSKTTFSILVE